MALFLTRRTLAASRSNTTRTPTSSTCACNPASSPPCHTTPHALIANRVCSHPPLGKLVFYYVGLLTGYDYHKCNYANIADDFGEGKLGREGGSCSGGTPRTCHVLLFHATAPQAATT